MLEGKLVVKIVHGRDIYPEDGNKADPYCEVYMPDGNKDNKVKTDILKDIKAPINIIWKNNVFVKEFSVQNKKQTPLRFVVVDYDR